MNSVLVHVAVLLTAGLLDFLWIGCLMRGWYSQQLGALARHDDGRLSANAPAAVLVYLLIPLGITLFVLPRLKEQSTTLAALGWGAAFGLVLHGMYDLTNYSVIQGWPPRLTLVDIAWGCSQCGLAAIAGLWTRKWLPA